MCKGRSMCEEGVLGGEGLRAYVRGKMRVVLVLSNLFVWVNHIQDNMQTALWLHHI